MQRLPDNFSAEYTAEALTDSNALAHAFFWHSTAQGHDFWEKQRDECLTEEGHAALLAMLATHAAAQPQDVFVDDVARMAAWSETNYMALYEQERARVAEPEAELADLKGRMAA